MANKIQLRRDTAANWTSTNPVLAQGEVGYDLTSGKMKVGNGTSTWTQLAYFNDGSFSGSYADLTDKPVLFSGSYTDLTDTPTLFSGSYSDLTDKPALFSGSYADLTNIPDHSGYVVKASAPLTSKGAEGDTVGLVAFDSIYAYYCTGDYTDGTTDIWKRVAWAVETW